MFNRVNTVSKYFMAKSPLIAGSDAVLFKISIFGTLPAELFFGLFDLSVFEKDSASIEEDLC